MKQRLPLVLLLGLGLFLSACKSMAGAPAATAVPEVRYYLIADT